MFEGEEKIMIYWYKKVIDDPGFECEKKVLVFSKTKDTDALVTAAIVSDMRKFETLSGTDNIKVAVLPGMDIPVFTADNAAASGDVTSVVKLVYEKIGELGGDANAAPVVEFMKKIVQLLTKQLNNEEIAKLIVAAVRMQYTWEHSGKLSNPLMVDAADYDSDLRAHTVSVLAEINDRFTKAITSVKASDNVTSFQKNCTDKFFIEIPTRQELIEAPSLLQIIPTFDEVCKPYSEPLAYSVAYSTALRGNQSLIHDIEGDKNHNTFELYDNEKVYFNAIDDWVKFNMKEQFGTAEGEVIDQDSQKYLTELITMLYMLHWRHCDSVPDEISDEDEEDDCDSRYSFNQNKEHKSNSIIILSEFLKEVSAEIGYKAYIYALIQIGRWGSRKPTAIVFDGVSKEFDLGIGVVRPRLGDISKYHVVKSNGKECKAIGVVVESKTFKDQTIGLDSGLMVGMMTETVMRGDDGGEISILQFYHAMDFINLVKNGTLSADGVTCSSGYWEVNETDGELPRVEVNELIVLYEKSKNNLTQFPFYRSQELIDLTVRVNQGKNTMPQSLLTIVNTRVADPMLTKHIGEAQFSTYDDILNIIADTSTSLNSTTAIIEYAILGNILPVYRRYAEKSVTTVSEALNAWADAMVGYKGLPSLEMSEASGSQKTTKPVTAFGSAQTVAVQKPEVASENMVVTNTSTVKETQEVPIMQEKASTESWYKIVPNDAQLVPMVLADDKVVGFAYLEKVPQQNNASKFYTRYTILGTSEGYSVRQDVTISLYKIIACLLHNIYLSTTGSAVRQVYFANDTAINEFKQTMMTLGKGGSVNIL